MPIYDYTYKTWEGERLGPLFRWLAIPKFTYMEFFSKRMFIWNFCMAWFPFLSFTIYLYLLVNVEFLQMLNMPLGDLPAVGPRFFKTLIDIQMIFCFIFAFLVGSNLISRDLKHSAMVLYMSKPISRWEYFVGKFLTIFSLLMLITWLQATLLFVIQTAIAPENSAWRLYFWKDYAWIPVSIALYSTVVSVTLTLLILTASSLTKNSRYAGTTFAIFIIGSNIFTRIITEILNNDAFGVLSPLQSGVELGFYFFRITEYHHDLSQGMAWMGILGVWAFCAVILKWRLENAARYGR